ncbi:FAD/NAD(P)-binding domain-containing protein [Aspergillus steynii IBT 23096]|uniref:FAD/NAD(P)-binding domain-containing protein n=1 Tax=Aspergillus steynii IBT 23096 TaxID=1392250 RepID=A0A2I2FU83_9EURO|nr:FAD/NAD(P)-binding domain-containing protein [Aspergillus steynii IBT 23096]PLB44192.1 FAD/NAD(P)-binding domain-containing protein [Aspergillus steynii IBT 23096]
MEELQPKKGFRVVIVGGSIAGLTLAHCLKRLNIDYVVLESRNEIAPQSGGSIGFTPNGGRVLDQLGIFDDVLEEVEPLRKSINCFGSGRLIVESDDMAVLHERHGYPTVFLDRQIFLRIIYRNLQEDQSRVFPGKKAIQVEHTDSGILVQCADGSQFSGDLVVGADGIRSAVRQEMWCHMSPQLSSVVDRERKKMKAEYSCVFGISSATPGLTPGHVHRSFAKNASFLLVVGKHGRVFWFLYTKMSQTFQGSSIPRFTSEDLDQTVSLHLEKYVGPGVPFASVYKNVIVKAYAPLEEAFFEYWTYDRFVCIGDSVHKGGNCAVETAAALANHIKSLLDSSSSSYSLSDLRDCLSAWQSRRQPPVRALCSNAYFLTRLEALATLKHIFIVRYIYAHIGGFLVDETTKGFIASEKLDFLPSPKRSLTCQIPFDDKYRNLRNESFWKRLFWGMPLFLCMLGAVMAMNTTLAKLMPLLEQIVSAGTWKASSGETLDLRPLYKIGLLDKTLGPITVCFLPSLTGSDPLSRLHMISFLADCGSLFGIWILESYRRNHGSGYVIFTTVLGMIAQIFSIAITAPVYFLMDFLQSPLSNMLVGDQGPVRVPAAKALLPALILGYYLLTWASFVVPGLALKQRMNALWQLFPVLIPVLQRAFMSNSRNRPIASTDQPRRNSRQSIIHVRVTVLTLAAISSIAFLHVRFSVPEHSSLTDIFIPKLSDYYSPITSLSSGMGRLLRYDEVFSLGSGMAWILLSLRDMQLYGIPIPWLKVVGTLAAITWLLGPGTAFALGWLWREEMLADNWTRVFENRG